MPSTRSIAVSMFAVFVALLGFLVATHDSAAEWPAKWAKAEKDRQAETLPKVDFVGSEDGEHAWLIRDGHAWVGIHNDRCGTWIDLRSSGAKSLPELALCVPKDGGSPFLQVCETNEKPITINLVKAVRLLKDLTDKSAE